MHIFLVFTRNLLLCFEIIFVLFKALIFSIQSLINNWILSPVKNPDYFVDKKVLLTGSAGGLGSVLARELVDRGAFLILIDRAIERNRRIHKEVEARGGKCKSYVCDISQKSDVGELIAAIKKDIGEVDIIINNAGVVDGELITDLSENVIQKTFQVNVLAHFWFIKAFLPGMISRKSGHIVTIGSVVGQLPVANMPAYCASKAAAGALLEAVSADLHKMRVKGVTTTLVCPGHLNTAMFRNIFIRFPLLTPSLSAEFLAKLVMEAIQNKRPVVYFPKRYFFAVVCKNFLPTRVYWLMHNFLKTHHGMDTFDGKKLI